MVTTRTQNDDKNKASANCLFVCLYPLIHGSYPLCGIGQENIYSHMDDNCIIAYNEKKEGGGCIVNTVC